MNFSFSEPAWLLLCFLVLPLIWQYLRRDKIPSISFPALSSLKKIPRQKWIFLRHIFIVLRAAALILLALGLARPQKGQGESKRKTEGLDIMLVVDTSGSMRALDFEVNSRRKDRLEVVKIVLSDFISKRVDDRIGMVVFGTYAFPQAPLTLDHDVLAKFLDKTRIGMVGEDTAIGDAIGTASNRLKDLKAKSKIIILLTDGKNTAGKINPIEAAEAAAAFGIKVYTIGVGSNRVVPVPTRRGISHVRVLLDEKTLKEVAKKTNARYFKAASTEDLIEVYNTIDQLEKTTKEVKVYYQYEERFSFFVWPAAFLLLFEALLYLTRLRRVP